MQRALHLASDLATEQLDEVTVEGTHEAPADAPAEPTGEAVSGDGVGSETAAGPDFIALAETGRIDRDLAARLTELFGKRLREDDVTEGSIIDLDVFLRSIEVGFPAKPLPLLPLEGAPKLPPGTQRAAVNVSGRVITVVGRDGRAFILVDDRPIGQPFDLAAVPMSLHEISRLPDGTVHIEWPGQLRLVVAPDFGSADIQLLVA